MIVSGGKILAIHEVEHDETLTGKGTKESPLGVIGVVVDSNTISGKGTTQEPYSVIDKWTNDISYLSSYIDSVNTELDNHKTNAEIHITNDERDYWNSFSGKLDKTEFSEFENGYNTWKESVEISASNLSSKFDNYYDKDEVDERLSKVGGYKFVENHDPITGEPILDEGEEPSLNYIYLTKVDDSKVDNFKEWIWDDVKLWQCIGETSLDLLPIENGLKDLSANKLDKTTFNEFESGYNTWKQSVELSANNLDEKFDDYYLKTETSGASELSEAFDKKQDKLTLEQLSAISSISGILEDYVKNDDIKDFITAEDITGKLDVTAFADVSGSFLQEDDLYGYATEEWVKQQEYLNFSSLSGHLQIKSSDNTVNVNSALEGENIVWDLKTVVGGDTKLNGENGISAVFNSETSAWDVGLSGEIGCYIGYGEGIELTATNVNILNNVNIWNIDSYTNDRFLIDNGYICIPIDAKNVSISVNQKITNTITDNLYYLNSIKMYRGTTQDASQLLCAPEQYYNSEVGIDSITYSTTIRNDGDTPITIDDKQYYRYSLWWTGDVKENDIVEMTLRLSLVEETIGYEHITGGGESDGKVAINTTDFNAGGAGYLTQKITTTEPLIFEIIQPDLDSDVRRLSLTFDGTKADDKDILNFNKTKGIAEWIKHEELSEYGKVMITSADVNPDYLLPKLVSNNDSIDINPNEDGTISITTNDDYENIVTPATPFGKLFSKDVSDPLPTAAYGIQATVFPIVFPSGKIDSISFMVAKQLSSCYMYVGLYGSNDDLISGAELWGFAWRINIGSRGWVDLADVIPIIKRKDTKKYTFNWVVLTLCGNTGTDTRIRGKILEFETQTGYAIGSNGIGLHPAIVTNNNNSYTNETAHLVDENGNYIYTTFPSKITQTLNNGSDMFVPYIQFNITK